MVTGDDGDVKKTVASQNRIRHALFGMNCVSTMFIIGATLGWGPMQLMVSAQT